jgi:N-acetylmuramoyl-L-alanine amidase
MPRWLPAVAFALLVHGAGLAAAGPVAVDVVTADGTLLGRLTGQRDGPLAYFALTDVARMLKGTVRRAPRGDRATLVVGKRTAEVRRDQPRLRVDGKILTLAGPVRVQKGAWRVPGDLLVRGLPPLLGTGVRVVTSPSASTRIGPRPVATVSTPLPRLVPAPAVLRPRGETSAPAAENGAAGGPAATGPAAPAPPEESPGPIELRYRSYPTLTRVVLEGTAPLEPRLVESGDDLLVSLAGVRAPLPRSVRAVRDGLVHTLELDLVRGAPALRVTFERAPGGRRVYRLTDPPRLVLEFQRPRKPPPGPPDSIGVRTIVLDAGHGGQDPGGVGPSGLQEKDLTLDVARRVSALLREELGVRVVLTRTRDVFLPLRERTALANREKADLFVSIHVNAAPHAVATGTETYFLSTEATDNAARQAAAFENKGIGLETAGRGESRDVLRSILWDLTQSDFQQESSRLAESLQNQLDRALRLPSRGVKQAPFYVLGGAAMPAALVEIGFITNRDEEQRLRDDGYRDRIARAVAAGIATYKQSYDQRSGAVVRR